MIRYVCVQPRLIYYYWQLDVMINNFLRNGINPNHIDILIAFNSNKSDETNNIDTVLLYKNLTEKYNSVRFFYYEDTRINPSYISSIRPNILKQHFFKNPNLSKEIIFYHDCDILFTKPPDFSKFISNSIWYLSDTVGYIGYDYIISKGEDIYKSMCDIIDIDYKIPKLMNSNSGGAQYIMKNVTSQYWEKVEKDSENLYKWFCHDEPRKLKDNPRYHPIQKWTADMWAVLWNAWYFGNETKIDKYLDFSWATDAIRRWDETIIYHNAGVVNKGDLFYKGEYRTSIPNNLTDTYNKDYCSYNYFKEVQYLYKGQDVKSTTGDT